MQNQESFDCIVIGYNETPLSIYEKLLKTYGDKSLSYRDLQSSFVNVGNAPMHYMDLLNWARRQAKSSDLQEEICEEFASGDIPNLAAIYLASFLRKRDFTVKIINLFQQEKNELIRCLSDNPLCVAITTTFYVINHPLYEIIKFIKEHNRNIKIIVGGPLVANHLRTYQKHEDLQAAFQDIGADLYVTDSQGEATLAQVVKCLKTSGDLSQIPNIAYFEDSKLVRTNIQPEANSLDENYIDWGMFAAENLGHTVQMRTARSCAFNCAFCNYPTRAGKLSLANLATVQSELDSIQKLGGIQNVVFIDDTFNVPLPRFKDICRLIIDNHYTMNWFSYFRCSNADEEAISLMEQSGCKGVFLGIESGSPTILKNMNKAATIEKYAEGIKLLREHNIFSFASFILGFPGETEGTVKETLQFIRETKPTFYRTQLWYCEAGTPIDHQREKYGIKGNGFGWSHATMNSTKAMDHIERMILSIRDSIWLPQWSFDFWIIPYLTGMGMTFAQFEKFVRLANKLLVLEIGNNPNKRILQQAYLKQLIEEASEWRFIPKKFALPACELQ